MPTRTSYLLRLSGRLDGKWVESDPRNKDKRIPIGVMKEIIEQFGARPESKDAAGEPAAENAPPPSLDQKGHGVGWPEGFVLKGYDVCEWCPDAEEYQGEQTLFNLRVEAHRSQPGTLYDNDKDILPKVRWFYTYRDYEWHRDLKRRLYKANDLAKAKGVLIEPIWFREYQIYCGNGGP